MSGQIPFQLNDRELTLRWNSTKRYHEFCSMAWEVDVTSKPTCFPTGKQIGNQPHVNDYFGVFAFTLDVGDCHK